MKQRVKERIQEPEAREQCHHFWEIEVANGPTSIGKCKACGQTKEFYNAFPEFNPMKRSNNPLTLPELPEVKVNKGSKS